MMQGELGDPGSRKVWRLALRVACVWLGTQIAAAGAAEGVSHWIPKGISSPAFESHAAFDPVTGDFYFVRSHPDFTGWRILVSQCGASGWTAPRDAAFAGDGVEADPWFTPDGHDVWFISNRSTDGVHRKDLDIWRAHRTGGQWSKPERLPPPVNSTGNEWFPRLAVDGWLYFGSDRPGGLGKTDIWRARQDAAGQWTVQNAGPALNGPGDEYEALPSPDGKTMILMAEDGLYESKLTPSGWAPRVKLGPAINATGSEIGAAFSPSGQTVLFARDLKGQDSGEFFIWRRSGHESWPRDCPPAGR